MGIIGNSLVIWIAGFKMKTVSAVWFLNLAIADFIFDAFLPLQIISMIMDGHWPYGAFLCKVYFTEQLLNMFASISFLTVISIDRFVSIVWPFWARIHRTYRLASTISIFIWILSLIISIPNFLIYDVPTHDWNLSVCDYNYEYSLKSDIFLEAFFYTKFVLMCGIPFVCVIVCNILIACKLCRIKSHRKSRRPFRVITIVVVCFFICWFPYHFWLPIAENLSLKYIAIVDILTSTFECFGSSNSCLNPILYFIIGRHYKKNFKKPLLGILQNALSEHASREQDDTTESTV
ncbi:N-formyl peptide receptor 3-like [Bombina bombina]|uniref:N-formyl peptide receptor 3-like n=1 Tax=Bombina bombina TaxID=8345 RepID=UPI00235A9E45|nr:N-formyl peptide receptor 3-like [Bombina bombina]